MTNKHRVKAVGRRIGTPKPQPPEPTEEEAMAALLQFVREYGDIDPDKPLLIDSLPAVDRGIPDHHAIDAALEQIMAALEAEDRAAAEHPPDVGR